MSVKDQVTVAVQAVQLTGPLYSPRLLVTMGVDGDVQRAVFLFASRDGLREVARCEAPRGPLTSFTADLWCALVGDLLYEHLCTTVGIQGALEDLPTAAGPPVA